MEGIVHAPGGLYFIASPSVKRIGQKYKRNSLNSLRNSLVPTSILWNHRSTKISSKDSYISHKSIIRLPPEQIVKAPADSTTNLNETSDVPDTIQDPEQQPQLLVQIEVNPIPQIIPQPQPEPESEPEPEPIADDRRRVRFNLPSNHVDRERNDFLIEDRLRARLAHLASRKRSLLENLINNGTTVPDILTRLGLEKYIEVFELAQIDCESFVNMSRSDLVRIGVYNRTDQKIILTSIKYYL